MNLRIRTGLAAIFTAAALTAVPSIGVPASVDVVGERAPPAVLERIVGTLKERIPDLTVLDVYTSPVPGLYEVLAPDGLIYIDASGDHIFMGPLIATQGRKNLTQQRFGDLTRVDFASLPIDLAIKEVRGKGTRHIAVFADPKCPYCRELEGQLGGIDDVTIYTFLYPLESVHPGATEQSHQIWCAADRAGVWTAWMRAKQEVPAAPSNCSADPVGQIDALGHRLHVNTTPTVFFESGRRLTGTLPAEQFRHLLESEAGHTPAVAEAKPGS